MTNRRAYQRTHLHLSFSVDLREAPWELWMLLGEAQSKIEHVAGVPLRPDVAKRLHEVYLAKGAHATTAIEGNTLSEEEALKRIEGKLDLPPSREYLGQEIDNVVSGANAIFHRLVAGESGDVTYEQILEFNRQVLHNLALDEGVVPGMIRSHDVSVNRYHGAPHHDCEHLIRRLCEWLNGPDFTPPPSQDIAFGVLKAIVAHLYLVWIHPFGDGNGRTARLVEFQILAAVGVPLPAAHLLSDFYNLTRTEYYRQLELSSKDRRGILSFLFYAVRGFVDSLREQLALIRGQQMDVTWRNYVHETLGHVKSATETRQRHLVLDLSLLPEPVPLSRLAAISPRVAKDYAGVSERTLARDMRELISQGYLIRSKDRIAANKSLIAAFLPARRIDRSLNTE